MSDYDVRWWDDGDREAYLDLYRRVLGGNRSRAWFDWKYVDNPAVDHVPIVLAEREGELVGARSFFALEMAIDGDRRTALQPCDTMVAAAHRRNGLFTRMTERAIDRYRSASPAFFFNFPNDQSLPANRSLGWADVATLSVHYRIANPGRLAATKTDNGILQLAGRLLSPAASAYAGLRGTTHPTPASVTMDRVENVPAETLASIARRSPPSGVHAVRDERFYRWRFDNPTRAYATYVAERDGERTAIVVGVATGGALTVVELTDVLPLGGDHDAGTVRAMLDRIVADYPSADVFAAPSDALPATSLARSGFLSGEHLPLSVLTRSRTQVARGFDEWRVGGRDLRDPDNWTLTFADVDSK